MPALCLCLTLSGTGASAQTKIYWTDITPGPKLQRADLDGTNVETIVAPLDLAWNSSLPWMEGLAIDPEAGKIYWVAAYFPGGRVYRANLDGTSREVLVEAALSAPRDVILDLDNGKMYWVDSKIRRANLDGSDIEDVIDLEGRAAFGLALDPVAGKIYWTDTDLSIKRADLGGTHSETIVGLKGLFNWPLALDPFGRRIYWVDGDNVIRSAKLNGTDVEEIGPAGGATLGLTLDLSENKLYWCDLSDSKIWRSNLDGSDVEVVQTSAHAALDIVLDRPVRGVSLPATNSVALSVLGIAILFLGLSAGRPSA